VFLDREHYRQRVTYGILKILADDPSRPNAREDAIAVLTSLTEHLPLHIKDEEDDLFELLRSRALPEDRIAVILDQLDSEHEEDERFVAGLLDELRRIAKGEPPSDPAAFRAAAHAFAELQERHLKWENNVVLPLAQERLTTEDLTRLGQCMAARRGIELPSE
jgi:hemerythrin-like domain-containing protein